MEDYNTCKHLYFDNESLSFCYFCGCIISDSVTGIKPKKYYFRPDLNLFELFEDMKKYYFPFKIPSSKFSSFRPEAVNFVKQISKKLKLQTKTYYLSIALLDQVFLANCDLKHHITAISCILLAAKFNELNIALTDMCDFEIRGKSLTFSEEHIKEYEVICIKILNHNILVTTAYDYLKFFLSVGVLLSNDFIKKKSDETEFEESNYSKCFTSSTGTSTTGKLKSIIAPNFYTGPFIEKICVVSFGILDVCIEDSKILDYSQIHIACACITVARELARLSEKWSPVFETYFNIPFSEFEPAYNTIKNYYYKSKNLILETVDKSRTTKVLPHIMKNDEAISPLALNKGVSSSNSIGDNDLILLNSATSNGSGSASGSKYNLTHTPVNSEIRHPELINAPMKDDKYSNANNHTALEVKKTFSQQLSLKNQTSVNLPNYKDVATVSLRTIDDNSKKAKISINTSGSITVAATKEKSGGSSEKKRNVEVSQKTTIAFDQEVTLNTKVGRLDTKDSGNKTKYRRNSISEIKYEGLTKADLLLNKKTDKSGLRKFKSIEKTSTKSDLNSKAQLLKVFPANEHPALPNNSMLMIKKLSKENNSANSKVINTVSLASSKPPTGTTFNNKK